MNRMYTWPLLLLFILPHHMWAQEDTLQQEVIRIFQYPDNLTQDPVEQQRMKDSLDKVSALHFYSANGPDDLKRIVDVASGDEFVLIKKLSFLEGIKSIHLLQGKIAGYQKLDALYTELDSIEAKRKKVFESIIAEEQSRGKLFQDANEKLNKEIIAMDSVFVEATTATKEVIKDRRKKSLGMGFVGAALGVATGILIGLIGN